MGFRILLLLIIGLMLFLSGIKLLGHSLKEAGGKRSQQILQKYAKDAFRSTIAGTAVTAIIQSSSATTVMVVALVNAGMLSMVQAAGVILGANIGTTITSQIIAFEVSNLAPLVIFTGLGIVIFCRQKTLKLAGKIVCGLGVVFLGMDVMSYAMEPMKEVPWFINFLTHFENPLFGVLAGIIMTATIQSSSASIAILQTLAASGALSLSNCIYLLYGYNIGTCVTALLACIGLNVAAKRAALLHVLFNVAGVLFFILLEPLGISYINFVESLTPNDPVRQIANAHTVFNILSALVIYPFIKVMVNFTERLIPEHSWEKRKNLSTKKYAKAL